MKQKTRAAAAVAYDPERDSAPRVKASGRGRVAEKILEIAAAAGVPVRQDSALAEVLSKLDQGEEIPAETYRAVAEILAFLYRLDRSQSSPRGSSR